MSEILIANLASPDQIEQASKSLQALTSKQAQIEKLSVVMKLGLDFLKETGTGLVFPLAAVNQLLGYPKDDPDSYKDIIVGVRSALGDERDPKYLQLYKQPAKVIFVKDQGLLPVFQLPQRLELGDSDKASLEESPNPALILRQYKQASSKYDTYFSPIIPDSLRQDLQSLINTDEEHPYPGKEGKRIDDNNLTKLRKILKKYSPDFEIQAAKNRGHFITRRARD